MRRHFRILAPLAAVAALIAAPAAAGPQEKYERKGPTEWVYSYDDGRTVEKEERKGREYKREWKRGNALHKYERKADGSWKEEIVRGRCKTVREFKADTGEYKEDRSC